MAKPICVIKVDDQADFGGGRKPHFDLLNEIFEKRLPDYHVFVIPAAYTTEEPKEVFQFQVFYEKDFTQIQYEELKQLINESLKNIKNG